MSSRVRISSFFLVSLIVGAGCGPDDGPKKLVRPVVRPLLKDSGEAKARDHVHMDLGVWSTNRLGQGYEGVNGDVRTACASGSKVVATPPSRFIRFAQPLSAEEEAGMLGAPAGALPPPWRGFGFAPGAESDPQAVILTYAVEWRTRTTALDQAAIRWLVDPASQEFQERCGDQVVSEVEEGGRVLLRFQLRFATPEIRDMYMQVAGPAPAAWEIMPILDANTHTFTASKVSFSYAIEYDGQEPMDVIARLNGGKGDSNNVSCALGRPGACDAWLKAVIELVTAEGPGSIAEMVAAGPVHLGYGLAGWNTVGARPSAQSAPSDVLTARRALDALGLEQRQMKDRLVEGFSAGTESDRTQRLALASKVAANLRVLEAAARRCYSLASADDQPGAAACIAAASPAALEAAGFDSTLHVASIP